MRDISYIINELGENRSEYFNAIAPPIIQTSNFAIETIAELRKIFQDEYSGYVYSRGLNPTVDILRKKLAALDEAEDCLVFNSGASAIFSSIIPFVSSGDHIISIRQPYSWAQKCFNNFLPKFNVETSYIKEGSVDEIKLALKENTKLIYLESPNSWDYGIQDMRGIAAFAKSKGIITVVDNSYCTPIYQQPIKMGIDMVLQSATKYIAGHSDTVAGILTGSKVHMKKIFDLEYLLAGNGIQPFNAWLLLRGLRSLPARLDRISLTTQKVISFLKQHKNIERVLFPLDETFPQYELAQSQMSGACGLVTIIVKTNSAKNIEHFCENLKRFLIAVSWGGHESLVIPRIAGMDPKDFDASNPEHKMIRLYIGLEEAEYLIEDLNRELDRLEVES